jgi:hypothetical protein
MRAHECERRKERALRATPCTSPLVQIIGMSKQLLLVGVSVDRVGQRTTEHNRNTLSKQQLYALGAKPQY